MQQRVPSEHSSEQKQESGAAAASSERSSLVRQRLTVGDGSRQIAQRKTQDRIQNSARQLAQRRQLDALQRVSSEMAERKNGSFAGGLPHALRTNMETMSGVTLDDVRVHRNSDKPAQLNALAYAQGSDIHLGPGQEKHLPHEAWHVVQQRQGRVRPTMQLKAGVHVNDDAKLEQEADVMGARALSTPAGLPAETVRSSGAVSSGSSVAQRAVGFEFETGWLVHKDLTESTHDDVEVPEVLEPLKKKEKIGTQSYGGFKLEADEAGDNQSEIEFITFPPIAEHATNIEVLSSVMDSMEKLGNALLSHAGGRFTLDAATNTISDRYYVITPKNDGLKAGPQITSGIDLAKIPKLSSYKNAGALAPTELQGSLASIQNHAEEIAEKNKSSRLSPQLLGLLTLVTHYLQVGRGQMGEEHVREYMDDPRVRHGMALNYPKRIAEPLLARTQFGKLFSLIPEPEYLYYRKNPDSWLKLVIDSAGGEELYDPKKPVIERGIQKDETGTSSLDVSSEGPSREKWIIGMLYGRDRIAEMEDAESMGEFGDKTEGVGPGSLAGKGMTEAGIFEFRGAQAQKIPLLQWKKFAVDFLKYVITLHDQSLPIEVPKKKKN